MFVYTYRSQYLNRVPLLFATVVSKKNHIVVLVLSCHTSKRIIRNKTHFDKICQICVWRVAKCTRDSWFFFTIEFFGSLKEKDYTKQNAHATTLHGPVVGVLKWLWKRLFDDVSICAAIEVGVSRLTARWPITTGQMDGLPSYKCILDESISDWKLHHEG